jgi:hypothetical protein
VVSKVDAAPRVEDLFLLGLWVTFFQVARFLGVTVILLPVVALSL